MKADLEEGGGDTGREREDGICGAVRELVTPLGELRPIAKFLDCVGVAAPFLSVPTHRGVSR